MINISCVSFLNAAPFIYGLKRAEWNEPVQLALDVPSECARKLIAGQADIGLVPVAVIPQIPDARIISKYCIGADGPVRSVTLLSEVPVRQLKRILLDHHSRTSVALARILAARLWNIQPEWVQSSEGSEQLITGTTGGVVIGDRSLQLRDRFTHVTDLAEEWKKLTGLPFVFACWVSNKPLPAGFVKTFEAALESGMRSVDQVLKEYAPVGNPGFSARDYLTKDISYDLNDDKQKALSLFLNYLAEMPA